MIAAAGMGVSMAGGAMAQPGGEPGRESEVAGEVIVFPTSLEVGHRLRDQFKQEEFTVLGFAPISGMMIVAVEPGLEEAAIQYFGMVEGVRAVERSHRAQFGSCGGPSTPPSNDPDFAMQWHLHNTEQVITGDVGGTTFTETGICGVDIDAIRAWQRTRGSADIWLAVLDSGIDVNLSGVVNPEFVGRLVNSSLAISLSCPEQPNPLVSTAPSACCCSGGGCNYGYPFDLRGHGTWVTAVAAANHDDEGVMGVDPGCTILPVRVDVGDSGAVARTIIALEMIDDNNEPEEDYENVRVINMSYVLGDLTDEDEQTAAVLDVLASLRDEDVFVVTISGNFEGSPAMLADNRLPSASPDVITVGGTDNRDRRGSNAVHGGWWNSGRGNALDFMAPGFAILTAGCNTSGCTCSGCNDYRCNDLVGQPLYPNSGTSGSAPIVAGIISLVLARADVLSIDLDWDDVYDLLKAGAVDLGSSGFDSDYGWGRVNAYETIMAMERQYYHCDADVTHTEYPNDFGYAVPDGKVDSDDYYAFLSLYAASQMEADLTSVGYTTPGGGGLHGVPDGQITSDDFFYFLAFYSGCGSLGLCPVCP